LCAQRESTPPWTAAVPTQKAETRAKAVTARGKCPHGTCPLCMVHLDILAISDTCSRTRSQPSDFVVAGVLAMTAMLSRFSPAPWAAYVDNT
jgi:hypothetical protein